MEATIDQFLSVLAFNHYYLLDRLRERFSETEFKDLLEKILIKHQEELSQQYEILCMVTVRTDRGLIFTYETHTNVQSGAVNVYQNNVAVRRYQMGQVEDVQLVALYHKAMPFEDIIALSKEKRTPQSKKYHNKLFDRVLQISKAETLTNPSPNPAPSSCFNTPIKKSPQDGNGREFSTGKSAAVISKKLMLISDSEQEQAEEGKKGEEVGKAQAGSPDDGKVRENIIIQKLRQNQYGRVSQGSHSPRPQDRTEKKMTLPDHIQPAPLQQSTSKKSRRQQQTQAREQRRRRQLDRQSAFMKNWLGKVQADR